MPSRIVIEPGKRSGQPCIRLRITVWEVLSWRAAGMTDSESLRIIRSWSLMISGPRTNMPLGLACASLCKVAV
jgi:hypothetical protein